MLLNIKIDSSVIISQLRELDRMNQSGFILSKTLNTLAKKIQSDEKIMLSQNLHIKRPWVLSQVKINKGQWATKTRLKVTIEVADNLSFLSAFEQGEQHLPLNGHKFLCVPNKTVFGGKVIGKDNPLSIKSLNLHMDNGSIKGNNETFILNPKNGKEPMIMQDVSPHAKKGMKKGLDTYTGLRVLYFLKKATFRPKKISWYNTANNVIQYQYNDIATDVMRQALADTKKT